MKNLWKYFGRGLPPCKAGAFSVNTNAGDVLRALSVIDEESLWEDVKVKYALRLLLKPLGRIAAFFLPKRKKAELLNKALSALSPKGGKGGGRRTLSLTCDSELIYTALLQSYGIDILREKVDFRLLPLLAAGAGEDTLLHRVVEIRTAEIPPAGKAPAEYISRLSRLKAIYALPEESGFQNGMNRLFDSLARGGAERNSQWTDK